MTRGMDANEAEVNLKSISSQHSYIKKVNKETKITPGEFESIFFIWQ